MTQVWPALTAEIVIGIDSTYNFMNYIDPENPVPLVLAVDEPTTIIFSLKDDLITSGWTFQDRPFVVGADYSINFSSYSWLDNSVGDVAAPKTKFRLVFQCARLGVYEYSLMFVDSHDQKIGLDPKIENGGGQ